MHGFNTLWRVISNKGANQQTAAKTQILLHNFNQRLRFLRFWLPCSTAKSRPRSKKRPFSGYLLSFSDGLSLLPPLLVFLFSLRHLLASLLSPLLLPLLYCLLATISCPLTRRLLLFSLGLVFSFGCLLSTPDFIFYLALLSLLPSSHSQFFLGLSQVCFFCFGGRTRYCLRTRIDSHPACIKLAIGHKLGHRFFITQPFLPKYLPWIPLVTCR
jgi:hypothetical protein